MRKTLFIVFLLLSILNDAELKENLLSKMKVEIDEEEPILKSNYIVLKNEASKIVQNLFGISFSFTNVNYDKEVTIYNGNPKITAKLSSSCGATISFGQNNGFIQVKNGVIVSEQGTKVNLSSITSSLVGKLLNLSFEKMTATLTQKLKGAIVDGIVNFSFSPTQVQISATITKSKGSWSCDGTVIITIKPGITTSSQPSYDPEAVQKAIITATEGGAIAIGAIILYKLVKGGAGFAVGGPAGALIGLAT